MARPQDAGLVEGLLFFGFDVGEGGLVLDLAFHIEYISVMVLALNRTY